MGIAFDNSAAQSPAATPVTPGYPTGIASGKLAVIHVVAKPETTTIDTVVPAWVTGPNAQGGTGATGADVGQTRSAAFFRVLTGAEAGTVTINTTGGNSCIGRMWTYTKDPSAVWDFSSSTSGSDATHGLAWSVTGAANLDLIPGDVVLILLSRDTDSSGTPSAQLLTVPGCTVGAVNVRGDSGSITGNDIGYIVADALITDGHSTGPPTYSQTDTTPNRCGCVVFVRLRAVSGAAVPSTSVHPGRTPNSRARFRRTPSSAVVIAGATDYTIDQTDSAGLTDSALQQVELLRTDSAGLTDTATQQLVKDVTATDSAGLTDTAEKTISAAPTDSAGLTDTAAATQALVRTDSAGLTDTSLIEVVKLVAATDSAGLTDTTAQQQSKVITDSAGLTDTQALDLTKAITDSAGLTDTSTRQLIKPVDQTDSAGLTDNATRATTHQRQIDDSAGLTDTSTITGGTPPNPPPQVGIDSSATAAPYLDASATTGGLDTTSTAGAVDNATTTQTLDDHTTAHGLIG